MLASVDGITALQGKTLTMSTINPGMSASIKARHQLRFCATNWQAHNT